MKQSVRVLVFNADEDFSPELRADLLSIPHLQIVAEVDELSLLDQAIAQFPAELMIAHLDPVPDVVLPVVCEIARDNPGLAVFVMSESIDGPHVLSAMRAGVREFLTKPVERQTLSEAIEKAKSQSESAVEVGPLISILGTIGGVGASMLAVNLAVELNALARQRPVAVVDLDFRYGQLGTMLDLQADYTIADLCDTPEQLDMSVIEKAMVKHSSGIHLLARPNQFSQADQITAAHCASVLISLQQNYEYVVVDGPNRFDPGGLSVLDLADVNLLMIQLLVTSVRNAHRMLEELRESGYNMDRFRIICNRVGLESGHLESEHVASTLNMRIHHTLPDDWNTVSSAVNTGVPFLESGPKTRIRAAIRELAEAIADPDSAAKENANTKGRGLLGKIFG